jgi:hypothetical protein
MAKLEKFTEEQVRAVLEEHTPTAEECDLCGPHILCTCDWRSDYTVDHIIEALKKSS